MQFLEGSDRYRRWISCLAGSIAGLILSSCVSLQSVSLTQIPKQRSKTVTAMVSKTIFLGFNFDNDFVDDISSRLAEQCPGGKVTGILTKDSTTSYVFVFRRQIEAQGYCIQKS